jgi:hypothetical protein
MSSTDIFPAPIRGATFTRRMFVKPTTGTLVGCTITLTVKRKWSDASHVLQAISPSKITVIDAVTGEIEINFTDDEMEALDGETTYVYDVQVVDGAGQTWKKLRRDFPVVGDVT